MFSRLRPPSTEFMRALMEKMKIGKSFNGIASASPEIGLILDVSSGTKTPSLQTLAMTDDQRRRLASELEFSIGVGASRNRQILSDQAKEAEPIKL